MIIPNDLILWLVEVAKKAPASLWMVLVAIVVLKAVHWWVRFRRRV
jgi:hypothetical protein